MALPIQTIYFRGFMMYFEYVGGGFFEGRSVAFWFLLIGRLFRYIAGCIRHFELPIHHFVRSIRHFWDTIRHFARFIRHFMDFRLRCF